MSTDHDWIALHAFYAANANPMLTQAIGPLADELRADGTIDGWFFIRYWMEGPHVRLRLHPAPGVDPALVEKRAREALGEFLTRRPALYEEDRDGSGELYKGMYLAEYGEDAWNEQYGEQGEMPFRSNNSVDVFAYERELDRYGGPDAIAVAERHFEFSSDEVIRTIASTSVHLRTILLGQGMQQTLLLAFSLLGSRGAVRDFLQNYRSMWETSYAESSDDQHDAFDKSYERMSRALIARLLHVEEIVADPEAPATATERRWSEHCDELRTEIADLHAQQRLWFRDGSQPDLDAALRIVLSSYIHMSNNRLGVSILDEIYLSYVGCRALDALAEQRSVA